MERHFNRSRRGAGALAGMAVDTAPHGESRRCNPWPSSPGTKRHGSIVAQPESTIELPRRIHRPPRFLKRHDRTHTHRSFGEILQQEVRGNVANGQSWPRAGTFRGFDAIVTSPLQCHHVRNPSRATPAGRSVLTFTANRHQTPLAASHRRCMGTFASIATTSRYDNFRSSEPSDLH